MAHDASNNNPAKETVHALIGIIVLLTIILGIAISAWLRPAGNHEPATTPATAHGKALEEKLQAIDAPKAEEPKAEEAKTETPAADSANEAEASAEKPADTKADDKAENTAEASAENPAQSKDNPEEAAK